tara:strand:- start:204 stop:485 length:282 start_codon:yes stop_codon:yes gene_type:complete
MIGGIVGGLAGIVIVLIGWILALAHHTRKRLESLELENEVIQKELITLNPSNNISNSSYFPVSSGIIWGSETEDLPVEEINTLKTMEQIVEDC